MLATELARVGRSLLLAVVPGDLLTVRAVDALRVELGDQLLEASAVVVELLVELEDRVARLRSGGSARGVPVWPGHAKTVAEGSTAARG